MELMENAVHVRDAQFLQVSSGKTYFVKRLHELMREKKKLTADLQRARRNLHLMNIQSNFNVMCHKEVPDNNTDSDGNTTTFRTER